ncbi:exonuclease domain-containing protein [Microbacterium tenebrionis]|uniref:exonuclease domain-containing protein n=1 Tax=Microbacterium tenebrionis TaxID=2830665 RepID=UPI001C37ABDA|nr:exonuclease domain-containing protein [Microbacterium ihumii]
MTPIPAPAPGFATIDFETTGFYAEGTDRAIEVSVVHSDPDGTITGQWETLVNPGRDLGRQDIHGITAREILSAPQFAGIAGDLIDLLTGRVIVAHNASFDLRFLDAELGRAGYWGSAPWVSVCTMRLARTYLGSGTTLADCCAAFDIELGGAHRAAVDARATAELFAAYIGSTGQASWQQLLGSVEMLAPHAGERHDWLPRADVAAYTPSFLERIIDRVPDVSDTHEQAEYLALVERCLLDRYLSEHEKDALVGLAERAGLGRATVERLHRDYLSALVTVAWADGVPTEEERADLYAVAHLLEVPVSVVDDALARPVEVTAPTMGSFALSAGDVVVLTGEMLRPRSEWEERLREHGIVPKPAVTKAARLVIAADPDSLSGKARKARDYGIPIVGETWLADRYA